MADPAVETSRESAGGLWAHLCGAASAKLAWLTARLQLAGLEGKEAAIHYAIILALAVLALVLLTFGYLFLVIGLVFLVALAFEGGNAWIWVMLGAALLHIVGAVALALVARIKIGMPMFPATIDEFRKDQEWLKTQIKKS